jgi:hypothetical protein
LSLQHGSPFVPHVVHLPDVQPHVGEATHTVVPDSGERQQPPLRQTSAPPVSLLQHI